MVNTQNDYSVINKIADTKEYKVTGSTTVLPLRDDEAGALLALFAADFHKDVESLNKTDCHGYNRRKISGSDEWSNHASGTAIDLNASKHEYGKTKTYTTKQYATLDKLLEKYEGVIKAGYKYRGTKDEMHFEIDKDIKTVKALVTKLTKKPEPAKPSKPKNRGPISLGNIVQAARQGRGSAGAVIDVQKALVEEKFGKFSATGYYGPLTKAAFKKLQESLGFKGADADGIPGRKSLQALGFEVK